MSLLLPILYVTATVLMFAGLTAVAIDHREGLPAARWVIVVLLAAFVIALLALVQLCRAADWIDRTEHAQTAAAAVGISRTVPGSHVARKHRQMESAVPASRAPLHGRSLSV